MTEEDKAYVPPIMRLPREIRGMIFNKLTQTEMVMVRYVCHAFKSEVDDFCEFSVVLNERNPHLPRISELRIRKCKVLNFLEPATNFLRNDDNDNAEEIRFFKYPGLLRSLKIQSEKISPENFYILLKDTTPHLREFCGVLPLELLEYEGYPDHFKMKWENLTRLKLSISMLPCGPIMGPPPRLRDQLLHRIFDGFGGGSLGVIKMMAIALRFVGFQQASNFSAKVLSFIAENHKSLEHVDVDMIQGHGMMSLNEVKPLSESDLATINFKLLKKVKHLKSIRVVNSTAIGVDLWAELLAQQRSLQFLETDILPVPNQLYRQIILNNEDTIVHIDIGDLTLDDAAGEEENRYFDASVFQNCRHLRKLTLDRNTLLRRPFAGRAELINLHAIPEYLEELNINYFTLLSDELLILFSSGLSQNLKNLALTQCGELGEFGVDGTVLQQIISMRNISFIEISPLNFSDPEESMKLNAILTTYGYAEGHNYFQLSKVSENFQINFDDFMP